MSRRAAAALSAAFFLVGPGLEAGLGPWVLTRWERGGGPLDALAPRVAGIVLVLGGLAVVLGAFVRFARDGVGTPSPVAPPGVLVVRGAYRWVRHPMYAATAAMIVGQGLLLAQAVLLVAAAAYVGAFAFYTRRFEDPRLAARFGAPYEAYRRAVPGWLPRRPSRVPVAP